VFIVQVGFNACAGSFLLIGVLDRRLLYATAIYLQQQMFGLRRDRQRLSLRIEHVMMRAP